VVQIPAAQGPAPLEIPERGLRFFPVPRLAPAAGGAAQQAANENPPHAGPLPGMLPYAHDFHDHLLQMQQLQRQHMDHLRQLPRMRNVEELQARLNPPLRVQPVPPIPGHMPLRLSPRR
jgi:hypothetical protein